jgi:LysR family transcriptional regulator, transcription activator of glutamate synthase operon
MKSIGTYRILLLMHIAIHFLIQFIPEWNRIIHMEFKQVEYFLQIIDSGSFSAAADELYISQSSLSKQIMALEKDLGCTLFDRSKRRVSLTAAGSAFLSHAQNLNAAYQSMRQSLAPYQIIPNLSIITIPVIAEYKIASSIAKYKQSNPGIHLRLEEREAAAILPAINERQFDLAFVRDNYLDRNTYDCIEVAHDQLLVALSRHHRLAQRKRIALAELQDENFIMFDKGTVVHELAIEACRAAGFEPRIFYASLRVESILGMVASGSGIALIMKKIFDYHKHAETVGIPLKETIASKLVLTWLKDTKPSKEMTGFIEFIKAMHTGDY